jgi:LDH2 family malate/lactate/ureidoglycolate dehydrogenase
MRLAIEKAQQAGIGLVAMRHTEHFGAAGYYPWLALPHDMIGIALTGRFYARGVPIGMVPTNAGMPMFSTNPIAISFPTATEPPILLDMATTVAPYNRVMMHRELGRVVPLGWGLDAEGIPTTDPASLKALLPLGGGRDTGGHKGYGLALMVETLCALLSGEWGPVEKAGAQTFEGYDQQHSAHFFGAIRVDAFRPVADFKAGMDAMIRALHAGPKALGQDRIYVAGEPEHDTEQERTRLGIPLPANVVADLREIAAQYAIPFRH